MSKQPLKIQKHQPREGGRVFWKIYRGDQFVATLDRKKDAKKGIEKGYYG